MPSSDDSEKTRRARLRTSHADRDQAVDQLKAAFVHGRLTKEELVTRTAQVYAALTYADLAALTADLPAEPPAARPPGRPVPAQPRRQVHPSIKAGAGVLVLMMAVWTILAILLGLSGVAFVVAPLIVLVLGVPAATVVSIPILVALKLEARRRNRSRGQLPPRPAPGPRPPAPPPPGPRPPPPPPRPPPPPPDQPRSPRRRSRAPPLTLRPPPRLDNPFTPLAQCATSAPSQLHLLPHTWVRPIIVDPYPPQIGW